MSLYKGKSGHRHAHKISCEDEGENLGSASQGPTKIARKQQEAKVGAWGRFFHIALGRNADTLILNFCSPETWEINFCYSTYSVCGTLWWQSKQTNTLYKKKKKGYEFIRIKEGRRGWVFKVEEGACAKGGRYQQMRFKSQRASCSVWQNIEYEGNPKRKKTLERW